MTGRGWDEAEGETGAVTMLGIATTLPPPPRRVRVPKREFNPGFHVAAPGPSHEDDPPPRRRRPRTPPAEG